MNKDWPELPKARVILPYPFDTNVMYDKCLSITDISLDKFKIILLKNEKGIELAEITIQDVVMLQKALPLKSRNSKVQDSGMILRG